MDYVNKTIDGLKKAISLDSKFVRNAFNKNNSKKKEQLELINNYLKEAKDKKIRISFEILDKIREDDETTMLNGARDEIEKVVKKDDLFIKYTDFLKKDLKGLEPKSTLFNDIEEQWGFFLNKVEGKKEEEIQKEFSIFIKNLKDCWEKDIFIMKNSGFICQRADWTLYCNIPDKDETSILGNIWNTIKSWFSNDEEKIKSCIRNAGYVCNKDTENNPELSFVSYYYKAISDIFLGYTSDAYKELEKSIQLIQKDINFMFTFSCMIKDGRLEKLSESLNKNFTLYNNIKVAILEESKKLVGKAERKILIKKKNFVDVFKDFQELKIEDEVNSLKIIGFEHVFFLYEKASFWKSLGIVLLGALQICIGCLISSVPIIGIFSVNLIQKGFTNITKGIEMMMNGKDFKNLREFFDFQKAIFFQRHLFEQITLERDEKKPINNFI